jgi:lysyl-tRNA synthetase class 2
MTENNTPFIEDNDQTRARREHLDKIQALTGNAYPNKFRRSNVTNNRTEGEDTITSIVSCQAITQHVPQPDAGARPTAEQLAAANEALKEFGDEVRVSGRISVPPRVMGKAAFVHLSDGRERLQIYVRRDDVQQMTHAGRTLDGWELFSLLDHGDFIGVEGFLFVTKTGELSIHVRAFEFLAKALLPMPDKLHGISDPEIRQRQRYADLIAGSLKIERDEEQPAGSSAQRELTTREVFERRSKIIREMRAFLDERGYIEVETPMLTPIASGAAARPFKTHHNALDIDLYARIAPELYLKRLLVGGFERVYELNRNFRNEGISTRHNPEFTMLEFYCAYMDVNGMMDFCEEMLRTAVLNATGSLEVIFTGAPQPLTAFKGRRPIEKEVPINFSNFARLRMKEAISLNIPIRVKEFIGEDVESWLDKGANPSLLDDFLWWTINRFDEISNQFEVMNDEGEIVRLVSPEEQLRLTEDFWEEEAAQKWKEFNESSAYHNISEDKVAKDLLALFDEFVEKELEQPTFIIDYPKIVSPLSKASPANPNVAERFELFIARMECANGFSELNDPLEQYERFREQGAARERGDEEAMQMDTDYVRALAYGMPPAAGIGIGIDRIVMLLTNRRSIRDVILFPHMRPVAPKTEEATEQTALPIEQAGEQAEAANE